MASKVETQEPRGDVAKHALALLIVAAAVFGFYWYSEESTLYRVLALLLATGLGAAVFYQTQSGRALWTFCQAARTEVRKVVWPTRNETLQTTAIVFVLVLLVGLFLALLDWSFGAAFKAITGL